MKIIPFEKYSEMYCIDYEDGTFSDFCNYSRINNAFKIEQETQRRDQYRKGEQSSLEARGCV